MNYIALMKSATMGNPRRLRPMILWTMLEYALRGTPYGILLLVVWELFLPLERPGAAVDLAAITLYTGILFVSLVLLYLVNQKSYYAAYRDSYEICADGRIAIAEHLRRLSMGFFNSRDPGDIGAYLVSDYANIETLISHILPQVFGSIAMPAVLIVSLAFFSWKLALAAALVIPLAWPLAWISRKIITWAGRRHQKSKVEAASRMIEYIQGIRLIKSFNLGVAGFERLEKSFRILKRDSIRLEGGAGPTMILASFVLNAGLSLIMLFGFSLLLEGETTVPVYIMFLILGTRIYEPLLQALMFLGELNYMRLGVDRVNALINTPPLPDGDDSAPVEDFDIEFRNVSFRYNNTDVLKGISLAIPTRSLTALVGPSGSGKTTVTRLIARFWDVNDGAILIGGRDIRSMAVDDLLSLVSIVFQDVYLFNDTILNNILIGRRDATHEEVIDAARRARCHDFIDALPEKYDTLVGEGGGTLSGGEKQRISIARAILKNAPVVLLDEATASLDPENELYLQEAIGDLVRNRTVVVIAHRLNTITGADQIIVMDEGGIVERGTHEILRASNGLYSALWDEQQRIKGWKFTGTETPVMEFGSTLNN